MSKEKIVCYCSHVTKQEIIDTVHAGAKTLDDVRKATKACTVGRCKEFSPKKRCCSPDVVKIIRENG